MCLLQLLGGKVTHDDALRVAISSFKEPVSALFAEAKIPMHRVLGGVLLQDGPGTHCHPFALVEDIVVDV